MKLFYSFILRPLGWLCLAVLGAVGVYITGQAFPLLAAAVLAGALLDSFRLIYWRRPGIAALADAARALVFIPIFWVGLYAPARALFLAVYRGRSMGPMLPTPEAEIAAAALGILTGAGALWARSLPGRDAGGGKPGGLLLQAAADAFPEFIRRRAAGRGGTWVAAIWLGTGAGLLAWELPRLDPAHWTYAEIREYAPGSVKRMRFREALSSGDLNTQAAALNDLMSIGEYDVEDLYRFVRRRAVPALREGTDAERREVLHHLGNVAYHHPVVAAHYPEIRTEYDEIARRRGAVVLLKLALGAEAPTLAPLMLEMARSGDAHLRSIAAYGIVAGGADAGAAVPALRALLGDPDGGVRLGALWGLGELGPAAREAEADLRRGLQDANWWMKMQSAAALVKIRPDTAREGDLLRFLFREGGWRAKPQILSAARASGGDAVPVLVEFLRSEDKHVRWLAIEALGAAGPAAAAVLPDLLPPPWKEYEEWDTRQARVAAATAALGIGLPSVYALIAEGDADMRRRAADMMQPLLASPGAGQTQLIGALRHPDAVVRREIADRFVRGPGHGDGSDGPAITRAVMETARAEPDPAIRLLMELAVWKQDYQATGTVPVLAAALLHEHPSVRSRAAEELKKAGPAAREALPGLARVLKDTESGAPYAAVGILAGLKADARPAVPALREAVMDPKSPIRRPALNALHAIAAPAEFAPIAIDAMRDDSLRSEAAGLLSQVASAESGPALMAAVRDPARRDAVIQSLAALWRVPVLETVAPELVPELMRALMSGGGDGATARSAARVLSHLGPKAVAAVPALTGALTSGDPGMRAAAADALGAIGPAAAAAAPDLAAAVRDRKQPVRAAAVTALGNLGREARAAVPALAAALNDEWDYIRLLAAEALGRIGPEAKEAVPALTAAMRDRKTNVFKDGNRPYRAIVADALGRIGPASKDAVPVLIEALSDEDRIVRGTAATALAFIGPDAAAAVPALMKALEDPAVRGNAAMALGHMGQAAAPAVPALIRCLRDPDKYVSEHATVALWRFGPASRDAIPELVRCLKEGRHLYWTAQALSKMGPDADSAVPALVGALRDGDAHVRGSAAEVLGHLGLRPLEVVPALTGCLTDPDAYVRGSAATALGRFGPAARSAVPALEEALKSATQPKMRKLCEDALSRIR